jgi:UDPglucose 6-dehydrogenase
MDACREHHPDLRILYCNDALSAAEHADALVVVTEWPEFTRLNLTEMAGRMNNAVLIDGRNLFDPEKAREAGFAYNGIGRCLSRSNGAPSPKQPAASAVAD